MVAFIPSKGDFIWLDFDPQIGVEIKNNRPALVLSPKKFNLSTKYAIVMPATRTIRGNPFEVECYINMDKGVILSHQIHSYDWRMRNAKFICKCKPNILQEALEKFMTIIEMD